MLKNLDFLGDKLPFFHQSQDRLKTSFGGLFSLLMTIMLGVLIFGFGQDFFKRKNPNFISSNMFQPKIPMYTVNNKNFSIAFRLEDINAAPFNQPQHFSLIAMYSHFKLNNSTGEFDYIAYEPLPLVKCSLDMLFDEQIFFNEKNVGTYFCPVLNNTLLGGSWAQDEVAWFDLRVNLCIDRNNNEGINNLTCSSALEKQKVIEKSVFLSIFLQKTQIDPSEYLSAMSKFFQLQQFGLSPFLFKFMEAFFVESVMDTDYGWLISDVKRTNSLGASSKDVHVNFIQDLLSGNFLEGSIARVSISFSNEMNVYYREYPKAQTLAAQVGGILKIFITLGYLLISRYNLHSVQLSFADFTSRNKNKYFNNKDHKNGSKNNSYVGTLKNQDIIIFNNNKEKNIINKDDSQFSSNLNKHFAESEEIKGKQINVNLISTNLKSNSNFNCNLNQSSEANLKFSSKNNLSSLNNLNEKSNDNKTDYLNLLHNRKKSELSDKNNLTNIASNTCLKLNTNTNTNNLKKRIDNFSSNLDKNSCQYMIDLDSKVRFIIF